MIDLGIGNLRIKKAGKSGIYALFKGEELESPLTNLEEHLAAMIEELEQRLAAAMDLLQQIHDCPVNWVESTIPKGGMDPDNPKHRGQVVGTQHISYTRLYRIAAFLHQNIDMKKGE